MRVTYWCCRCLDDSECYNIRAKTKREAIAVRASHHQPDSFSDPYKITLEYKSGFELVEELLSEDRGVCLVVRPIEHPSL